MDNGAIFRYKDYTFWKRSNKSLDEEGHTIKGYIADYLKEKFPNCRIIGQYFEFNNIDLYVIEEKLPIEIQATMRNNHSTYIAQFEKNCRQQIEENIKTIGRCWLFFDSEFLRYLQRDIGCRSSIQFDWLYKLIKRKTNGMYYRL